MLIREIPENTYSVFSTNHEDSTPFHSTTWLRRVIVSTFSSTVSYLGVYDGETLLGCFPVISKRFGPLHLHGSPLPKHATYTLHPLLNKQVDSEAFLAAVADWVKSNKIYYFQLTWIRNTPQNLNGGTCECRPTLVVPLQGDILQVWKKIKREARNRIRHALKSGIRLHWSSMEKIEKHYQELLDSTYGRQGISQTFPKMIYSYIAENQQALNVKVLSATLQNEIIASIWLIYNEKTCYFWDGASKQDYRKLSPNHLLHWSVMRWCKKSGIVAYDLIGVGGRAGFRDGITRFKRSLGGQVIDMHTIYWMKWWLRILLNFYRCYLRIKDKTKL